MHNNSLSREDCYECRWFGEDMAGVNKGLVHIENMREKWIDEDKITNANILEVLTLLLEIYEIFLVLLKPMDNIL